MSLDPEIAAALAPMAASGFAPPAVGDIEGRRTLWEPIIGAAGTAQPIPADVTSSEHYATADDGARIAMRWYDKGLVLADLVGRRHPVTERGVRCDQARVEADELDGEPVTADTIHAEPADA
jgi:hypothetical protein